MNIILNRITRFSILAAAFLAPIAALPVTPDPLFIKIVLLQAVAALAGLAWLANAVLSRRLTFMRTPLNYAFLALAGALMLATILSAAPFASLWGPDQLGEKAATLIAFLVIAFLIAATFERADAVRLGLALLASLTLLGLYALASIAMLRLSGSVPAWLNVNPVGAGSALATAGAIGFLLGFVLLVFDRGLGGRGRAGAWLGRLAVAALVILFPLLVLTASRATWALFGSVVAVFIAGSVAKSSARGASAGGGPDAAALRPGALVFALAVLLASAFFAFRPFPLAASIYQPPLEVSPSLSSTLSVGVQALAENPLSGFGPANFRLAYSRFRDADLNTTVFWAARFGHGFSYLATLPATMGATGAVAFLGFILVAAVWLVRDFWRLGTDDALAWAFGASALFGILFWAVFPANAVVSFLTFLGLGLAAALLRVAEPTVPTGRWRVEWQARRTSVMVATPALNFVTLLGTMFAAALTLIILYTLGAHYAAAVLAGRANLVLTRFGNADTAAVFLDRAIRLNPGDDRIARARAGVGVLQLQRLVAEAAADPRRDVSDRFRGEFSLALAVAQQATARSPRDPQNWSSLAQLYETVLPYLPGADRAALQAYQSAQDQDPTSPLYPLLRGRVHLAVADLLTLQVHQTAVGERRSQLETLRAGAYQQARQAIGEARDLKPDLADAHFLLAQLAIRENDLGDAIVKTEDALRLAPGDIGVAFQLGVLYYRADRLQEAKTAFEQAILLNENYSNARYFLGLIWDRKGDRDGALSQFEKIQALNPGNEEVKKIIANLEAGRPALAGIVPPAQAPEARREAPVPEQR